MRLLIPLLLFSLSVPSVAQITSAQQKALNNYVDYANQSADEVTAVVKRIMEYYPTIYQKRSWGEPRFVCPVQQEDYFLNKAINDSKVLAMASAMNVQLKSLRSAAEKIDEQCKALDTYHKLEDYKQDNFAKAESLISELQLAVVDYKRKQAVFQDELDKIYKKLNAGASPAYIKADAMMRKQIDRERAFIQLWMHNLKEDVHTGWIADKLEQSVLETDVQLSELLKNKPALNYPASSMWPSFQNGMSAVLEIKRRGLDGYNHEAKKSDKHSNDVYLDLINYFNGALVADYNAFVGFAEGDKYFGLKAIKIVPSFEIRLQEKIQDTDVKPFKDIVRTPVSVSPQKMAIPKPVFESLHYYIEFINETWRQVSHQRDVLRSFNSSAAYFKGLTTYSGRAGMNYSNKDFVVPLSYYQKAVTESKVLQPAHAKALNEQAEVILAILKEMEQHSAALEVEVSEKRYEKDQLKHVYDILERNSVLLETWDDRKELLYNDVSRIFDAYPPAAAASSWYISGKALRHLTSLDHDGLFKAKSFYKGDSTARVSTAEIDQALREVIAKEYDNMKGIQRIGRNNGLCPYTPYEDLPEGSKSLSEEFKKLKPAKKGDYGYQHPYHAMVYRYNDVVDDYNKFCELAQVPLLKTVKQPELFVVSYPDKKTEKPDNAMVQTTKPVAAATRNLTEVPVNNEATPQAGKIKVIHDTVYIEKRDTVYMAESGEDLRSMEGYAPNNMVLLLDVSGSMNAPEKLPLLKKSILDMLSMMRQEDEVAIVVFSGKPKVLLSPESFKAEEKIKKAINDLKPSGKTDGNAGLKLAYKVADENYIRGGNNRIILATDGEFALSEEMLQIIGKFSKADIFLSVFNFGRGASSAKNLERLSVLGKGNYEYISKENVDMKLIREAKSKKRQ